MTQEKGKKMSLAVQIFIALAITIGLFLANAFKGIFPALQTSELTYEAAEPVTFMDTLVGMFPSNFLKPFVEANML